MYRLESRDDLLEVRLDGEPRFSHDFPPGPIRRRLEGSIGIRALLPQLGVRGLLEQSDFLDNDGKVVARLYREQRRAHLGGRDSKQLPSQLRLEPLRGYAKPFRRIAHHLESTDATRKTKVTEYEEAWEALGLDDGFYSSKINIRFDPEERADAGMKRLYLGLLATMETNLEGVKQDWDSEFLHDFRVAVRRTRSGLTQVKGVFPPRIAERFRRDFAWLGKATGPCRDLDVYLLKMGNYLEPLNDSKDDLFPLVEYLLRAKKDAHKELSANLESRKFQNLLTAWKRFLLTPVPRRPRAERALQPIWSESRTRLARVYRRVIKRGLRIDDSSPPADLHRVRLDCKKLRYLLEFFRSLFEAESVELFVRRLKDLQNNLGDFNDLQVQQAALREWAEESRTGRSLPAATLLAMGRLLDLLESQEGKEQSRFGRTFARFAKPANRRLFERLIKSKKGPQ